MCAAFLIHGILLWHGPSRIQVSWQSPTRPVTTFGTGTREQAGQVLAPGFKGYAPRSAVGNPGPGAYRNVPGSLGIQVETLSLRGLLS